MRVIIGLVGAGSAALRAHLPALTGATEADAVAVAAVVDPRGSHRDEVTLRCPGARGYETVQAMLDEVTPDLVIVASPPSTHLEAVRAAFRHEVDVVCEKPLGVLQGDAEELTSLAAAHPARVLVPVHQYRFAPAWAEVRRAVAAARESGRPSRLRIEVERPGTDPLSAGGWRADGLREGGVLGDHGVHYLALAWTLDPHARLLSATLAGEPGHETAGMDLELAAGSRASISVSYAGARRRNLVELTVAGGACVTWADGDLTLRHEGGETEIQRTAALSDRQAVNDLYVPFYDAVLRRRLDHAWRATRTAEALGVARLLSAALDAVR